MNLDPVEIRVLGCLVEKRATTPDQYPLTVNALVSACNQTTNRSPVVHYEPDTVDAALTSLRAKGLIRVVYSRSNRAAKYRHVLDETLGLDDAELAVLGVLALRGGQTPGELKARTERLYRFEELDDVETTLDALAGRPEPLVARLPRQPGQKEARYLHLLAGPLSDEALAALASAAPLAPGAGAGPAGTPVRAPARAAGPDPAVAALEGRVETLEAEVAGLRAEQQRLREEVTALGLVVAGLRAALGDDVGG